MPDTRSKQAARLIAAVDHFCDRTKGLHPEQDTVVGVQLHDLLASIDIARPAVDMMEALRIHRESKAKETT